MINIFCVKIGTKYNSKYANKLYEQCKKHITHPFKFFCYTDDPDGLLADITTIPMVDNSIDVIVFNKLYLLSNEFTQLVGNTNTCLFFDLDIVFKSNIDELVDAAHCYDGSVRVINAVWKKYERKDVGPPRYDHNINSSCIAWKPGKNDHIWQRFANNKRHFQNIYARGMDCFLAYEFKIQGGLPEHLFYSYLHGVDRKIYRMAASTEDYHTERMKIPIVLFNGPTFPEDIEEFIESGFTKEYTSYDEFMKADEQTREKINDHTVKDMLNRIALSRV